MHCDAGKCHATECGEHVIALVAGASCRWLLMQRSESELRVRLAKLITLKQTSMEQRAALACGDDTIEESPEYLRLQERTCSARIAEIHAELAARGLVPGAAFDSSADAPVSSVPSSAATPVSSAPQDSDASTGAAAASPVAELVSAHELASFFDDDVVEVAPPPLAAQPVRSRKPWDEQVDFSLTTIFGLRQFRPDQREAIDATLGGRDVFCLMPTGGGKSLCYQLPATITQGATNGLTVVVSPLIALIHNQVKNLLEKNVPTLALTGDMSEADRSYAQAELFKTPLNVRLLYVTPEFVCNSRLAATLFQHLYQRQRLARFVIDEAHCVDQWGHDFRPDYVRLDWLRREYPRVPLMALTATARIDTVEDIQRHLGMRDALVLRQSFNRPNLTYSVRPKRRGGGVLDDMAAFIQARHANDCGIIYCLSRRDCENVASDLGAKYGIRARHFHAGLDVSDKLRIQENWESGQFKVIVATIAFGMGIDKADVRFVIHHSMPKSLEGYYQETGRAGRDGRQSECVLFWAMEDARKLETMIRDSSDASPSQVQLQLRSLHQVQAFCQSLTECRRTNILKYFGETFDPALCHASCDNCQRTPAHFVDMTGAARDYAHMVKLLANEQVTKTHCTAVFRGSMRREVKDRGHHRNIYHGRGAQYAEDEVKRLVDHLLSADVLAEYAKAAPYQRFPNYYVRLGPRAPALLRGALPVRIDMPSSPVAARRLAPRSPTPDAADLAPIPLSPERAPQRPALGDRTNARVAVAAPVAATGKAPVRPPAAARRSIAPMPLHTRRR